MLNIYPSSVPSSERRTSRAPRRTLNVLRVRLRIAAIRMHVLYGRLIFSVA